MTSRNSRWNNAEKAASGAAAGISADEPERTAGGNAPFLLSPAGKDYLWGGVRLNEVFSKGIALSPLAETWECSTHPDGPSAVASGIHSGKLLTRVIKEHPEYLGSHPVRKDQLPILIKLIDAGQDLSIQVHPTDAFAAAHENGQLGKTEMWYVLDAAPETYLIYGLYRRESEETIRQSIREGTIGKYLQKVKVHKGDVFYVEAGTIHAIGAGALLVEVQESSNLTYRLYDYDRIGKDGKKRELHIEKALAAADLGGSAEPVQPMRVLRYRPGWASEFLCRCKYFQVERVLLNTEMYGVSVDIRTGALSFEVLLCVEGSGVLDFAGETLAFDAGKCIFFPADSVPVKVRGRAQLLRVRC